MTLVTVRLGISLRTDKLNRNVYEGKQTQPSHSDPLETVNTTLPARSGVETEGAGATDPGSVADATRYP